MGENENTIGVPEPLYQNNMLAFSHAKAIQIDTKARWIALDRPSSPCIPPATGIIKRPTKNFAWAISSFRLP